MLPGIDRLISAFAQVSIIFRSWPAGRMQAVIALIRLETAFRDMHANDRVRRNAEQFEAFQVRRHMGFADQHITYADLLEVIAQRWLAHAQWPAVPVRAMRTHVAAGIE